MPNTDRVLRAITGGLVIYSLARVARLEADALIDRKRREAAEAKTDTIKTALSSGEYDLYFRNVHRNEDTPTPPAGENVLHCESMFTGCQFDVPAGQKLLLRGTHISLSNNIFRGIGMSIPADE